MRQVDKNGQTAAMHAARWGHAKCLELCVRAGADMRQADTGGRTAAMHAAEEGYAECLKLCVRAGADMPQADTDGWTAVRLAACWGNADCLELCLRAGADPYILPSLPGEPAFSEPVQTVLREHQARFERELRRLLVEGRLLIADLARLCAGYLSGAPARGRGQPGKRKRVAEAPTAAAAAAEAAERR